MSSATRFRPRRSCLYMPGANARALEKARDLPADVLILDLEDAVAPEHKDTARTQIASVLEEGAYGEREVLVRANALDTDWGAQDLTMAVSAGADGVLIPKVTSAADIETLDAALSFAGAKDDFALWVMIEMPLAILNIQSIAACVQQTRLVAFVMGTNDLAKEYNARNTPDRFAFQVPLALALAAAKAYGLVAIDGVFNDFRDDAGLARECEQGITLGFDGKTLIHPAQLETCNRLFSPEAEAVAEARAIIAAFDDPDNAGKGVIQVNGKMTELLHLEQAQQLVAVSEAIAAAERQP